MPGQFFKIIRSLFLMKVIGLVFVLFSCGNAERAVSPPEKIPVIQAEDAVEDTKPDSTVAEFLNAPQEIFKRDKVPLNFRIIALSNLAEYFACLRLKKEISEKTVRNYFEKVVKAAIALDSNTIHEKKFEDKGLFLGQFNIVLGAFACATGDTMYKNLNLEISQHLQQKLLAEPSSNMASWNNSRLRFPADNAAILYSLFLCDRNYATSFSAAPVKNWLAYMKEKGTHKLLGLHISELSGGTKSSNFPRGCALSFTIAYMGAFATVEAKELWNMYKKEFFVESDLAGGFREWPKEVERKADEDSGPIILGIGAAASGFGMQAAKAMKDEKVSSSLSVMAPRNVFIPGVRNPFSILERSILLKAEQYFQYF